MGKKAERSKLCLQCLEESHSDLIVIVDRVKENIQKDQWANELYTAMDIEGMPYLKLCPHCPYKVEHVVIEQKEVL